MLDQILAAFDGGLISLWGPFALLVLCGIGLPVPEDIILVAAGFLAADNGHSVIVTAALMYFGILGGDLIIYGVGRSLGQRVLSSRIGRLLVSPEKLPKVEELFRKYGSWVVFVGRFLPGLRAPVFMTAGTLGFPALKFIFMDGLAAILSAPLFVWLGHFAWEKYADDLQNLQKTVGMTKFVFIGVVAVVAIVAFFVIRSRAKKEKTA